MNNIFSYSSIPISDYPSDVLLLEGKLVLDNNANNSHQQQQQQQSSSNKNNPTSSNQHYSTSSSSSTAGYNTSNSSTGIFAAGDTVSVLFSLSLKSNLDYFHSQQCAKQKSLSGASSMTGKSQIVLPLNPQEQQPQIILNGDELTFAQNQYLRQRNDVSHHNKVVDEGEAASTCIYLNNFTDDEDARKSSSLAQIQQEDFSFSYLLSDRKTLSAATSSTASTSAASYIRTPSVVIENISAKFESTLSVDGSRYQLPQEILLSSPSTSSQNKTKSGNNSTRDDTICIFTCDASSSPSNLSVGVVTPVESLHSCFSATLPSRLPPSFHGVAARVRHVLICNVTFFASSSNNGEENNNPNDEVDDHHQEDTSGQEQEGEKKKSKTTTTKNDAVNITRQTIELRIPIIVQRNDLEYLNTTTNNNGNMNHEGLVDFYRKFPLYFSFRERFSRHDARASLVIISGSQTSAINNINNQSENNKNDIVFASSKQRDNHFKFCQGHHRQMNNNCNIVSSSSSSSSSSIVTSIRDGSLPLEIPIVLFHSNNKNNNNNKSNTNNSRSYTELGTLIISSTDIQIFGASTVAAGGNDVVISNNNKWRAYFVKNKNNKKNNDRDNHNDDDGDDADNFLISNFQIIFEKEELIRADCVRKGANIPQSAIVNLGKKSKASTTTTNSTKKIPGNIDDDDASDDDDDEDYSDMTKFIIHQNNSHQETNWVIVDRKQVLEAKINCLDESLTEISNGKNSIVQGSTSSAPQVIELDFTSSASLSITSRLLHNNFAGSSLSSSSSTSTSHEKQEQEQNRHNNNHNSDNYYSTNNPSGFQSNQFFSSTTTTSSSHYVHNSMLNQTLLLSPSFSSDDVFKSQWKLRCTFGVLVNARNNISRPVLPFQPGEDHNQKGDVPGVRIGGGMLKQKQILVEEVEVVIPVNFVA